MSNMAEEKYDCIVVGAGPGGYVAALRAALLGLSTALVEKDQVGGTCLHWGCIPMKVLLRSGEAYRFQKRVSSLGIHGAKPSFSWADIQKRKKSIVQGVKRSIEALLHKRGVSLIQGEGTLRGEGQVRVVSPEGRESLFQARFILLATGSRVQEFPLARTDSKTVFNSDDALSLADIPSSIIILGAGAIGVEFAHLFHSLGVQVHLIEILPRILPGCDEDISNALERIFLKRGIRVITGFSVERIERRKEGGVEVTGTGEGRGEAIQAEKLLIAVGRKPNTDGIGLEEVGLETVNGFIPVGQAMDTRNPGVFAIGDIVNSPQLAHVASREGIIAAEKMAGRSPEPLNLLAVPFCVYCHPGVAGIGLSEGEAKKRGLEVKAAAFPFRSIGMAAVEGEKEGFVKIVAEEKKGTIVGIHLLGEAAWNLAGEGVAAITHRFTLEDLCRVLHPHPSLCEVFGEAAELLEGFPIHF